MASEDRRIEIKNTSQVLRMCRAEAAVAQAHQALRTACEPGTTAGELDQISIAVIAQIGAKPGFLGYDGFPATACISVNEEVIHRTPGNRVLQFGNLISFNCGVYILDCNNCQWHADVALTMICGGGEHVRPEDLQLMTITQRAPWSGIAAPTRAQHLGEIGDTVGEVVYEDSLRSGWEAGVVEEYVGHGIDANLHQAPDVLNFSTRSRGPKTKTGMVPAIEPVPARGGAVTRELADGWTVVAVGGSCVAYLEHIVVVLPGEVWVLTEPDGGRSGLAPFGLSP